MITLLITVNFTIQILVNLLSAKFAYRIGYRLLIITAHICASFGLVGLGFFPEIFTNPYTGLLLAVTIYAVGSGLIEVLVSPIVEACPTEKKSASMSLVHSFYCWGQVAVILFSTLFFVTIGIRNWRILAVLWAVVPLINAFYFSKVPIAALEDKHGSITLRKLLSIRMLWLFVLLMLCAGASELAMSQWASAFAESGLRVPKTTGDLAGPCMFAFFMGVSRLLYSKYSTKISLRAFMLCSGILCVACYFLAALAASPVLAIAGCALCGLSVGTLWPGMLSLAVGKYPFGGTALFALLAIAGAIGGTLGPAVVGMTSELVGGDIRTGILAAVIFPVLLVLCLLLFGYKDRKQF